MDYAQVNVSLSPTINDEVAGNAAHALIQDTVVYADLNLKTDEDTTEDTGATTDLQAYDEFAADQPATGDETKQAEYAYAIRGDVIRQISNKATSNEAYAYASNDDVKAKRFDDGNNDRGVAAVYAMPNKPRLKAKPKQELLNTADVTGKPDDKAHAVDLSEMYAVPNKPSLKAKPASQKKQTEQVDAAIESAVAANDVTEISADDATIEMHDNELYVAGQ